MAQPLFLQNIIACIWDFDKTLSPGYMQAPIFELYWIDSKKFWKEVEQLPNYYKKDGLDLISTDTLYLNHILTYTRQGTFKGLNNGILRKLGAKIELYEGLPDFFDKIKHFVTTNPEYVQHEIQAERLPFIGQAPMRNFRRSITCKKQKRVQSFGEANYNEGSQTSMWIKNAVETQKSHQRKEKENV